MRNLLSLCDNASCKLAFIDAAEFGNSAEQRRSSTEIRQNKGKLPFYLALHILKVYGFVGLEIFS